jgi:hypothetical protein
MVVQLTQVINYINFQACYRYRSNLASVVITPMSIFSNTAEN